MDISPISAEQVIPSASDKVFMELRTRQAPVPQERSIMPCCTADQGSFFGKRSFGNGLAVPGTYVVVPRDFHMITFDQNI